MRFVFFDGRYLSDQSPDIGLSLPVFSSGLSGFSAVTFATLAGWLAVNLVPSIGSVTTPPVIFRAPAANLMLQ